MFNAIKIIALIALFAVGIWLYVLKETGTVPMGTLLVYLGVWLVAVFGALALLRVQTPKGKAKVRGKVQVKGNPFDRMTASETERAVAVIQAKFAGRPVSAEDTSWLATLLERYAPHLTQSQQMEQFTAHLRTPRSIEQVAPTRQNDLHDGPDDLHDGPAVVLARAARRPGFDVSRDGVSWFGGLPALGQQAWPLDTSGQPMTPLAQIDLTGLGKMLKVPGLPDTGSLAFFAALPESEDWSGRVVHVPKPGAPSQPPTPLPVVQNHTFGRPLRRGEPEANQRVFPRMAMQLVAVGASGQTDRKAFDAEVKAALGPGREFNLSTSLFKEAMPNDKRPLNRDSLLRFLHGARIALGSGEAAEKALEKARGGYVNTIKGLTEKLAGETEERATLQARLDNTLRAVKRLDTILADFGAATGQLASEVETMTDWAQIGDRWQPLPEAELAFLDPLLEPWTTYHGLGWAHLDRTQGIHRAMRDCVSETLLVMAVAEDEVFSRLPEPVREAVSGPWRQPYNRGHHQMFGCPDSIQDAASTNAQAYLLLQLQCDDLAGFHWGDAGVLQFWIRPDDLKAGRWDRAYMTFEGN
jgi:Domain of unknown function (DUF1963)